MFDEVRRGTVKCKHQCVCPRKYKLQLHVQTTEVHRRYLVLPVTNYFNDRPIAEHILAMGGVRSSRAVLMDIVGYCAVSTAK